MIWPRRSLTAMVSGTLMEPAAAWTISSTSIWVRRFERGAGGLGGTALLLVPLPQETANRVIARHEAEQSRRRKESIPVVTDRADAKGNADRDVCPRPLRARLMARRIGKIGLRWVAHSLTHRGRLGQRFCVAEVSGAGAISPVLETNDGGCG